MDFNGTTPYDELVEKWSPILEHNASEPIQDGYKKKVTAQLLENQENAMREQAINEAAPLNSAGSGLKGVNGEQRPMGGYDPILISLVRRSMPNLLAYDICGVQPMNAPTGLIFAMKAQFGNGRDNVTGGPITGADRNNEALFAEAGNWGGTGGGVTGQTGAASIDPFLGTTAADISLKQAMTRAEAENLGDSTNNPFSSMAFSIERTVVTAKTRALKAEYTTELAQDLKAVHGLDAETELANILSTEILAEINREVVRTIYGVAKLGSQQLDLKHAVGGTEHILSDKLGGIYDLDADSDGRWSAERWRGLMFQIERECNVIAKQTRRGKGNFIICDADTASALAMGGFLNISPALNQNLNVDDTGNTFAGLLNGKIKVYVDPYATASTTSYSTNYANNYFCAGYRGTNAYDAGLFYCPYVPLQMVRAVGENTFQPKIGFKTRYGMVSNPFVTTTGEINGTPDGESLTIRKNQYYRITRVLNLHGNSGT